MITILCCALCFLVGSAQQTHAIETKAALEKLQWRIVVAAYSYRNFTFYETVDKLADLGADAIYGFNFQKIGGGLEGTLNPATMSDDAIAQVKKTLDEKKLQLVALYYGSFPTDETECRKVFERSKMLGIQYFVSEPKPEQLPMLDKLAQEFGMVVGLHGHDKNASPNTWHPALVAKECAKYSPAIGAFNDTGHWIRSGLNPSDGVQTLKGRTVGFDLHDLNPAGSDVPLGSGVGNLSDMLEVLAVVNPNPILIGIEYTSNPENPTPDVQKSIEFLEKEAVRIASAPPRKILPQKKPGFYVGAASCNITPDRPVSLSGQFHTRISQGVITPVEANIVALEWVDAEGKQDYAIIISMDTCAIRHEFNLAFRKAFRETFPELDGEKLILTATHTHTAPGINADDHYRINQDGVMAPSEYVQICIERMIPAVKKAWESRSEGKFAYGLEHAVVAYNRRAIYADGTAVMYGKTNDPNFRAIEGVEDHDVGSIFFWGADDKLAAVLINVACPSQENEGAYKIDADFWAPVRESLKKEWGNDVVVLGLCGAAGDMSPHIRFRVQAEERMRTLRKLGRTQELARRIVRAVEDTWDVVAQTRETPKCVRTLYKEIDLPERKLTKSDYDFAIAEAERLEKIAAESPDGGASGAFTQAKWRRRVAARWEKLKENPNPIYPTCIRVVRIGDIVLCTNQFELYTDFGIQMKARSKAAQTFVVQLCDGVIGSATYLPSQRAVEGGGYGAIPPSNMVGPEGGQILVEETLKMVDALFAK